MKETNLLAWITAHTPPHPAVPIGIGDDMAAVTLAASSLTPTLALLKIDQALDRVHFDLSLHTPRQAGAKAVNRCLSDCAAMACLPAAILLSVALPQEADDAFARELFLGCQAAAAAFDCPLVGGDTAVWDQRLAITIAALGTAPGPVATRAGAQPDDFICVSGRLGGSILGRHMTFTPRIHLARHLATVAPLHAMMDLSDGLAADLPRLCARSNVGARIHLSQLAVHPDAHTLSTRDGLTPALHALSDGEDYELLFTLNPQDWPRVQMLSTPEVPLTHIGVITADPQLVLVDPTNHPQPWPTGGWEHHTQGPR